MKMAARLLRCFDHGLLSRTLVRYSQPGDFCGFFSWIVASPEGCKDLLQRTKGNFFALFYNYIKIVQLRG